MPFVDVDGDAAVAPSINVDDEGARVRLPATFEAWACDIGLSHV